MPNKSKRQNNNRNKPRNRVAQVQKQLFDVDYYVTDASFLLTDVSNTGFDLYTVLAAGLDYQNLQLTYGEFKLLTVEFNYKPFLQYSSLGTDYALGAFSLRQGIFDTTVTAKTLTNVLREPGSFLITNKNPWQYKQQIVSSKWYPSAQTNTAVSDVPKVNFYVGYQTVCSTNTGAGLLHLRVAMQCRSKLD